MDTRAARKVPDQAVADITPALSGAFTDDSEARQMLRLDCALSCGGRFPIDPTALILQVTGEFMPLQLRGVPTWIESGTSSIRSASAVASGSGVGNGLPSSRRH